MSKSSLFKQKNEILIRKSKTIFSVVLHFITYLKIKRIYQGKALNLCLGETARNIFIYGVCVSLGLLLV